MLRFGYNTNGFAHHELSDAIDVISELDYKGIALTLDVCHCNPYQVTEKALHKLKEKLHEKGLSVVIETGARFILNPFDKHEPTLISSSNRGKRIDFLKKAINIANVLEAEGVTFFSGKKKEDVTREQAWKWLLEGCNLICDYAQEKDVSLGFEPEPGMFIESMSDYDQLQEQVDHDNLKLTLDIGHVFCTEEESISLVIEQYIDQIMSIHIEDMEAGIHEHLLFGDGDIHFYPVLKTLKEFNYQGLINVELSRHSHKAPKASHNAISFLKSVEQVN